MSKIIAISGASATGKTTIANYLNLLSSRKVTMTVESDLFKTVWEDLLEKGIFKDYDDITRDPEYLCIFTEKVLNYYNNRLKSCKNSSADYVLLDCCWLDVAVYAQVNMWYDNILKDLQTKMLRDIFEHRDDVEKIYITRDDETKRSTEKFKCPFKKYNLKYDRDLEVTYYDFYSSLKNTIVLPSSETLECVDFITNDLGM